MRDSLRGARGISDAKLVEQTCSGDDRAFGTLVRRHHASAYRVALSITRRDDIAQDVVQDAFIKAFRALGGFRGDSSFRTWMMTVTANEARATLRKRGRWNESSIEVVGPLETSAPDPAEKAVVGQESARARAMLDTLPEKQRLAISARIDEGLSFREIASLIGSSEGAARVNYFHGIRRLRELME